MQEKLAVLMVSLAVDQLNQIQREFLRKYYSSFGYIFRQILRIRDLRELRYFCNLGGAFFKEFFFAQITKLFLAKGTWRLEIRV